MILKWKLGIRLRTGIRGLLFYGSEAADDNIRREFHDQLSLLLILKKDSVHGISSIRQLKWKQNKFPSISAILSLQPKVNGRVVCIPATYPKGPGFWFILFLQARDVYVYQTTTAFFHILSKLIFTDSLTVGNEHK